MYTSTPQLLTSTLIYIDDHANDLVKCRTLLDTCSTANFISEPLVKRLGIPIVASTTSIGAINTTSTESRGIVRVTIQSMRDGFRKRLTCLTIPAISDLIPSEVFLRNSIKIPSNIKLADPEFHLPRPVDLLIGSGATLALFSIGQINTQIRTCIYRKRDSVGWSPAVRPSVPVRKRRFAS